MSSRQSEVENLPTFFIRPAAGTGSSRPSLASTLQLFPLVEGDYYLSIFIDSDDVVSEFRHLVSLTVIDDHTRRETITYPARARGSVELNYRLRV